MFLIFGGLTVAWSAVIYLTLPDVPMTAWFLKTEDRNKAVIRVQENLTSIKNDHIKWYQVREAFMDLNTWFVILVMFCGNVPNGGLSSVSTFQQ